MRVILLLLTLIGLGFSLPAILIEKEIITKSNFHESYRKVKLYRAEGYEKEVWEEKTVTKGNPLGQLPFMKNLMKNAPQQGSQTQVNKGEKITHFKKGKVVVYTVNHENKSYTKQELEGKMLVAGFTMLLDCDRQGRCKPKIEPTNERRKVGRWNARKTIIRVNVMGRDVPTYYWFTKDSKLLVEADRISMKNILKAIGNDPKISPFLGGARKAFEEIKKKYGAVVMSETPIMGSTTVEVVKSVKRVNLPKSFFEVSKGYSEFRAPYGNYNMDMYRRR